MLRVCGITFVHTTNYGTCFQAYALQKAINRITVGNEEKCECLFVPLWRCSDHFSSKQKSFFYSRFLKKFSGFQENRVKYIDCSSICDLPSLNEQCDAFICGSDVIWNPRFNHKLGLYYLDFAEKYKFSYAPSFGNTNIEEGFLTKAGKWIAELDDVSVREQSSVDIVEKYSGRNAQVVADPVVLLTRKDWDNIIEKTRKTRRYIFSYTTHDTPEYEQFLHQLSKETGLTVVKAAWITSMKDALKKGMVTIQSPEKWLQQLRDADYVVTNSFHATVFSTMYHKKFFTIIHGEKNKGANFRMYDYLKRIGLESRLLSAVPDKIDLSDVDFQQSDKMINSI